MEKHNQASQAKSGERSPDNRKIRQCNNGRIRLEILRDNMAECDMAVGMFKQQFGDVRGEPYLQRKLRALKAKAYRAHKAYEAEMNHHLVLEWIQ